MKKKLFTSLLSATLLLSATPVFANPIVVNGKHVSNDSYVKNGRTMIPLRTLESMGINSENIIWDSKTKTITIFNSDTVITLKVNSNNAIVNGVTKKLDASPEFKNGKTYVPLRFLSDFTGANVQYNSGTKTVTITAAQNNQQWEQEKVQAESMRNEVMEVYNLFIKYENDDDKEALAKLKGIGEQLALDVTDYEALPNTPINNVKLLSHLSKLGLSVTAQKLQLSRLSSKLAEIKGEYDDFEQKYEVVELKKKANSSIRDLNRILSNWNIAPVPELK